MTSISIDAPARRNPGRLVRVGLPALLAVLLIALAVVYGLTWTRSSHDSATDSARGAATTAAAAKVPQVLSYSYQSLDKDIAAAKADTTGQFAQDYAALASSYISTQVPKGKIATTAKVTASSVVSASTSSVVVMLFLDQTTTGTSLTAPKLNTSTVEATMVKVHGGWLISNLTVVPQATASTTGQ